jgi:glycosyltransferase involved in cell wall biosynthesis
MIGLKNKKNSMRLPSVLIVSGEDVHLRIPSIVKLKEMGYEVAVAGPFEHPRFAKEAIQFFQYPLSREFNPLSDVKSIKQLRKIYSLYVPDIIHAFDTKPCILVPRAFDGRKGPIVVRTINGMGAVFSERSIKMFVLRGIYLFLHLLLRKRVSVTIFQNDDDMSFFKRMRLSEDSTSMKISGSGVAVQEIETRLQLSDRVKLRESLSLGDKTVFVTVSRMIRSKGIETLIEAAELLSNKTDNALFLLVGPSGDDEPGSISQQRLSSLKENIKYLGKRSDIYEVMGACDYFVLPTAYREGVPRAMLEALVVGLPIVVSDMPGCREGLCSGKNGWLVPPNDSVALAAALEKCLNTTVEKRDVMAETGKNYAIENFGIEPVAAAMDKLYKNLYSGK